MRIAAVEQNGHSFLAGYDEEFDVYVDLEIGENGDLRKWLEETVNGKALLVERWQDYAESRHQFKTYASENVKVLPPVKREGQNIICIGKNYADHAAEMGTQNAPEAPLVFTKSSSSLIADGEIIELDESFTNALDYEGEIAVVIGKAGRRISKENAMDHVFGYTLFNDITARDVQRRHQQFFLGKSGDTYGPIGPHVTVGPSGEPSDWKLETYVNGEKRQSGSMSDLIFDIAELIEQLSKGMTLRPGDVIATGTPAGVGSGFNPPRYLKDGDAVDVHVEAIGTLSNKVKKI
ncbi:fumarylacetoacetate hydrolase family protein [Marinococcus sp. PL1-022]|uniref:fumarylacetoacetate hydrolase family protein n=1 Tax=Marinococcus sp. PL1-022 TaxID=3095363 RepID=UPI0029C44000|nr:fumarylacetoacetate hydrolase family protein [Marinococcus sp. PL1-022]MDX6152131.1 fumarylacetoacetate hydrolase family protein [Marinococcus sp. PL1-022]